MTELDDAEAFATLHRLRGSIDNIDARMPASDPAREEQQLARLRTLALDADLDPEFAQKWFTFVVAEVIRHHVAAAEDH